MLVRINITPEIETTLNALLYPMERKKVSKRNKQVLVKMTERLNFRITYLAEMHKLSKASTVELLLKKFSSHYIAGKISEGQRKEVFDIVNSIIDELNAKGITRPDRNHNLVGANKRTLSAAIVDYMTQSITVV